MARILAAAFLKRPPLAAATSPGSARRTARFELQFSHNCDFAKPV
jgi:hypothetical protein